MYFPPEGQALQFQACVGSCFCERRCQHNKCEYALNCPTAYISATHTTALNYFVHLLFHLPLCQSQYDEKGMVDAVARLNPVSFGYEVTADFIHYKEGVYSR